MADIELVIKIPKDYYNYIKNISDYHCTADMLIIKNGTPLPKGHGRLIDVNELTSGREENYAICEAAFKTQTIIKADK